MLLLVMMTAAVTPDTLRPFSRPWQCWDIGARGI